MSDTVKELKNVLWNYKSGKFPKLFKSLIEQKSWESILLDTTVKNWSYNSYYELNNLFLKSQKLSQWIDVFLLPAARGDIDKTKKLNYHLYQALKDILHYKPSIYFKHIIIPVCEVDKSSVREIVIFTSLIAHKPVPVAQSAAALLKILTLPYSPVNCVVIRVLVDKKYALPVQVVTAVVDFYATFTKNKYQEKMPVLWQQSLLSFVQRYKCSLSEEQKKVILHVVQVNHHDKISREIRTELNSAVDNVRVEAKSENEYTYMAE